MSARMGACATEGLAKTFTLHLQGGARLPVLRRRRLRRGARRVRRAGRAVRRRQVHPDALPLRQLRRRGRAHPAPPPRRGRGPDGGRSAAGARGPARDARLCQPVPARDPARRRRSTSWRSRWSRAAMAPGRGAGAGAGAAAPAEPARAPARPAAGHLLRRRAAAGQPRARLRARLSGAAAGRADRVPRRRQPRRRGGPDPRGQGARAPRWSASSTTRRCATASPTACSPSSPDRRRAGAPHEHQPRPS